MHLNKIPALPDRANQYASDDRSGLKQTSNEIRSDASRERNERIPAKNATRRRIRNVFRRGARGVRGLDVGDVSSL